MAHHDFQLNKDSPSKFYGFTVKSSGITQTSESQENAFKKNKTPSPFFRKTTLAQIICFIYYFFYFS